MASAKCPPRPAFTLIELLVVIAILALLISVLLPMVSRAKDIAIRVQCSTSQRTVGQGSQIFAASHGGRAPGHAIFTDGSEMGWYSYLHLVKQIGGLRLDERYIPKPIQTMGKPDHKRYISCPGMRNDLDWGNALRLYPRAFLLNQLMQGEWRTYHPHPHVSDPASSDYWLQGADLGKVVWPPPPGYALYTLGVMIEDVQTPSFKIMMWESCAGTDYTTYRNNLPTTTNVPLQLLLNAGPSQGMPAYGSDPYAYHSFRHVLPRDISLYPTQATSNYLFIDGHVEILRPTDRINVPERFEFKPS